MFSQTVEYALRAVVFLAGQAPNPSTTKQIAKATQVPLAYLSKVIQGLCRAGLLHSQRGVGGGVRLVNKPADLSILDVVNAVDPIRRIRTCPLGLANHGKKLCALHQRMDAALGEVEQTFRVVTLADVIADTTNSIPLCDGGVACDGQET